MPQGATVLACVAEAEVQEKRCDARGISVSGEICCHMLYKNGEELGAAQMTVPYTVRTEGEFDVLSVGASVPVCRVTCQGNQLSLDAELQLALRAVGSTEVQYVDEMEIGADKAPLASDLEICYLGKGETLWSVARRYAVSPRELALINGVAEDAETLPDGVGYLLIPVSER